MQLRVREQIDQLRGDPRRFRTVYGALRARVYRLGGTYRPYVTDSMLEDACSDAVVAVMVQYQGHFDAGSDDPAAFDDMLMGYLFHAARNRLMSALQKDSRGRRLFFEDSAATEADAAQPWLFDPSPRPDEQMQAQQRQQLLNECLRQLSELARTTFQLALRGFNDQEIQRALQIASPSTVRRRVHDAKTRMIACVQGKTAPEKQP